MSESEIDQSIGMNGSFEYIKNGLPINWLVYTSKTTPSGIFTIQADTTIKKEGQQSLHFVVKECSDKGGWYSPGIAQEINVKAGAHYHIQCWIKQQQTKSQLTISSVDAKHVSAIKTIQCSNYSTDWQLIELDYQIPQYYKLLRLEFNVLSAGECWIDEVKLTNVTKE